MDAIHKKKQAIEEAKDSLQKAQIRREQNQSVRQTEDDIIRKQLKHDENEEIKRIETQRAMRKQSQDNMKQYLDLQKNMKIKRESQLKEEDINISKIGYEKEEQDSLKRNDYFDKLQKFQDLNDKKTQSLIKYMKSDPKAAAEERDKKMYLDGIRQEEKKWQLRENEEKRRRDHDIDVLKIGLSNQLNEK